MEEKDNIVDVESEVIEEKKVDNTGNSNQNDQSNTILFSILSYIGILWLIPLLVEKNDKVVRFHVNQGIVLFIFGYYWLNCRRYFISYFCLYTSY